MKTKYTQLLLIDIIGNSEQIYHSMKEIAEKINIQVNTCYEARIKNRIINKRYYIRDYIED